MFSLTEIYIKKGCKYTKCLQEEQSYSLKDMMPEGFFAPNVCITAIVGRNGAGKSSLLDLLFRMLNNFGFCLYSHIERAASDDMSFVEGIHADLYYKLNNINGILKCRNRVMALEYGNRKLMFSVRFLQGLKMQKEELEFEGYEDYTHPSSKRMKEVSKMFFYTIVTNYSLQAYISQDYKNELTVSYSAHKKANVPGESIWMDNLFHKNDGYMCPIVLNPFRDKGKIDMANEEHLTTQRLEAILIEEAKEHPFMQDYSYDRIDYDLRPRTIQYGFRDENNKRRYYSEQEIAEQNEIVFGADKKINYEEDKDLKDFAEVALNEDSYAHAILGALSCAVKKGMSVVELALREYVVYKVLNIAEKYPSYSRYGRSLSTNYLFCSMPVENREKTIQLVKELVEVVKHNISHIELKLNQALNMIDRTKNLKHEQWEKLEKRFTYKDYCKIIGIPEKGYDIRKRMEYLPPSIFHPEVHLQKRGNGDIVTFSHLSSGERQLYFMLSTLVYHIMNLQSIPTDGKRVRYSNVCIVMDEVEICFHPDYQRTFIKRFLDTIKSMGLNHIFGIHVVLTTHSPFLLSDIPLANILSLESGFPKQLSLRNTFCANVYDLLNNPFFMHQFIGDFASEQLDKLIKDINKKCILNASEYQQLKERVEMIGDDFIYGQLLRMLAQRFSKIEQLNNRKRVLEKELDEIKKELNKELEKEFEKEKD